MIRLAFQMVWIACVAGLAACAGQHRAPPGDRGERVEVVRVVSNGWHTAIAVPRERVIATGLLPEAADFPEAAFLEFGWGDRTYYQAPEATLGNTLRAALVATPAVMHVDGYPLSPEMQRPLSEIVAVRLTEAGFRDLVAAIAASFVRAEGRRIPPISRGLRAQSYFYPATGAFHLFNTCNTWTAGILRAGGLDISPTGIVTAHDLMQRLREVETVRAPRR